VRIDLYFPPCTTVSYLLTCLLATRRVPGYPLSYPAVYPGNELPDNGSPSHRYKLACFNWCSQLLPCSDGEKSGSLMTIFEVLQLQSQETCKAIAFTRPWG